MLKFKRKEAILKRAYHRMNKKFYSQIPREVKDSYRCRKIMRIRAKRLDIRIKCYYCRMRSSADAPSANLYLDVKGYVPVVDFCGHCGYYMKGGLHI